MFSKKWWKKTDEGIFLAISRKELEHFEEGDMKITLSPEQKILQVSKQIEKHNIHAESPGLVKVSGSKYIQIYLDVLEELVRKEEYLSKFWLETFNILSAKGFDIHTFEIDGKNKWREIDFHIDLHKFRKIISDKANI